MRDRQGRFVGYARKSSSAPPLSDQIEALHRVGCYDDNIWADKSGNGHFSQLQLALIDAREGDVFVVPRTRVPLELFQASCACSEGASIARYTLLHSRRADRYRVEDGHLVIPTLLRLIELKSSIKSRETRDGLAAARMRGRGGGRPAALSAGSIAVVRELRADRRYTMAEIAERVGVSRSTLYNKGLKRCRRVSILPRTRCANRHTKNKGRPIEAAQIALPE